MVNEQTLAGNWNDLKGQLRKKWGQLTNDDVQVFDGNVDRLIGMIQTKTGEARSSVERYLEELTSGGANRISDAAEAVRGYAGAMTSQARDYANQAAGQVRDFAGQAADTINQRSHQAADMVREGYREAETAVRDRPTASVAVCFGAGVLTGLLLALTLRSR